MEFAFVSPLNRKQILLDWINTIDEPKCLLAGSLDDLKDGEIFLEIMLHYLKNHKKDEYFIDEFKQVESFDDIEKFDFIVKMLKIISDDEEFFNSFSYDKILKSEEYLLDFIYQIKLLYTGVSIAKLEENKDYSHEEEGKSNNITGEVKTNAVIRKYLNGREFDEEKIDLKQANKRSDRNFHNTTNIDNNNYNNNNDLLNISDRKRPSAETNRSPIQNSINQNNMKKNSYIKRASYTNSNENNYENYIISETYKSSKITNNNNDINNEVSNDYIQSTCTNNQLNINNTYYSNKNNYNNDDNNFQNKNIYYENINKNKNYQAFDNNQSGSDKEKNLKIEKNIFMTLNPNSNCKKMDKVHSNNINKINSKSKEKDISRREKLDTKKLSNHERELMEELTSRENLKISNYSELNSVREDIKNDVKIKSSKNGFPYVTNYESRTNSRCQEKIITKNDQNKTFNIKNAKDQKLNLTNQHKFNSSFNSERSNKISKYKDSSDLLSKKDFKNNTDSQFNNLTNPVKNKIQNITERKIFKLNPIKIDRNELYSEREINQLNLFMGSTIKTKLEVNGQKIDFFLFHKLTNPIRNIDFDRYQKTRYINDLNIINERFVNISYEDQIDKFHHEHKKSVQTNNYSKIDEDFKKLKYKNSLNNRDSRSPSKTNVSRQPSISDREGLNLLNNIQSISQSNYTKNIESNQILNKNENDYFDNNVPKNLQIKLMNWLTGLNMIKEGAIKFLDIPKMCANGVFLSDLINRLEGRSETIKGIIRKTVNKSHIQVNINKLLDYLRSLEKFNPRNLWSNHELCSGDPKTIFELLDDIWHFYSNKNFDKFNRSKSKFKQNSFSSYNVNNSNFHPTRNNLDSKDNEKRENSVNSISLNKHSQKKSIKEMDKKKEMNLFSPIRKHDEERENKNIYENTNSDILNCLIGENGSRSNNKILTRRGQSESNLALPQRIRNENKENITYGSNSINKSTITHRNRDVIANCLGIETSRVNRMDKKNNSSLIPNLDYRRNIENVSNRGMENNRINGDSNQSKNKNPSRKKVEENKGFKSSRNNSNNEEFNNNCFIIFNKSNIKNLKNEIKRYDSKNVTIETEPLSASKIDEKNKYLIRPNIEYKEMQSNLTPYRNINSNNNSNDDFESKSFAKANKNDFSYAENSTKNRFLLSSPERNEDELEDRKFPKFIVNLAESKTKLEKDDILIREWLDGLGCKNTFLIDLTKDELSEFRDGLILSEVVSILENKKIHGINPNPKGINACSLNITKVLEILRVKKNMPYDYLWSEDEIYKGNPQIIIELLNQIKKAYFKESEFIIKNKNH